MAGRKVFTAGEILTSADVNSYLMDQSVMVFADSTARSSAIPTPTEGMVTYVQDANRVEVYDGSSFGPIGGILQVVSTTKTDTFSASVTSQNFVDVTGLNVSLTPSSTSSKVLITVNLNSTSARTDLAVAGFRINRDGSAIAVGDSAGTRSRLSSAVLTDSSTTETRAGTISIQFLDSPSTTSAVTYKVQAHNLDTGTNTIYVNRSRSDSLQAFAARTVSTITLMEVAG